MPVDPFCPSWDSHQVISFLIALFFNDPINLFSLGCPLSNIRIQALANLNEDDLPDVALQVTQSTSGGNTTWVYITEEKIPVV